MSPASLPELIAPDWFDALEPTAATIKELGDFLRAGERQPAAGTPGGDADAAGIRPSAGRRPGAHRRPGPVPDAGASVGLSFSVASAVRPVPRSLANIYRELESDHRRVRPRTRRPVRVGDQGVLLAQPRPHRAARDSRVAPRTGWERVTDHAIEALVRRGGPCVAILWGRDAQSLRPSLGDMPVIVSPPSIAPVGVPWLLRIASVQPDQRTAPEAGCGGSTGRCPRGQLTFEERPHEGAAMLDRWTMRCPPRFLGPEGPCVLSRELPGT